MSILNLIGLEFLVAIDTIFLAFNHLFTEAIKNFKLKPMKIPLMVFCFTTKLITGG